MRNKISKFRERFDTIEDDYTSSRNQNDDTVDKNQRIKADIIELEDMIQEEKDKSFELRGMKDKANHNVYKVVAEAEDNKYKEQELVKRLNGLLGQQK